jgi:diadenosine tetraphosphate (Ap4A) HIT family hydrolase
MLSEYDTAWSELNARLRGIEDGRGGLGGALAALRVHQQRTGFIKDRLEDVERRAFYNPQDPSRFFRIQYNPKRALRFNGSGITVPPSGITVRHDGCFLCRENIRWQQGGSQLGYEIPVGETAYLAWMNPFPLLPTHVVVATEAHRSQEWGFQYDARRGKSMLLSDLVALAARMPGYVGFYNGVDAGASIAGHMHFHFCQRPEDDPEFPLERAPRVFEGSDQGAGLLTGYPMAVAIWRGAAADVAEAASNWMLQWTQRNRARLSSLTGNFVASKDQTGDGLSLYFIPRERSKSRVSGLRGLIGGLEILGEVVFSSPEEKKLLDDDAIDYSTLESHLARVHTPMFPS